MPVPRMTTRRWMVAAAVVGLGCAVNVRATRLHWRALAYRQESHAVLKAVAWDVNSYAGRVKIWQEGALSRSQMDKIERDHRNVPRRLAYARELASLADDCERAIRRPWLPGPPDPPKPN